MGSKQTIELNGKHYDARTGKILSVSSAPTATAHARKVNALVSSATSIDGFSKKLSHPPRKVGNQAARREVNRSHTLKRTAVKKPVRPKAATSSKKIAANAHVPVMEIHPPSYSIPRERLKRLEAVKQSKLVSRYSKDLSTTSQSTAKPAHKAAAAHVAHAAPPIVKAVSTVVDTPQPSAFEQAIDQAEAHQSVRTKKPSARAKLSKKLRMSPRVLNVFGFTVALMMFAGYFGYNNAPNVSMRVAAMRANVEGSIPAYKPSGFSLDRSIKYKQGEITVNFVSNSDQRNFAITQTASGWDSTALHQNFVTKQEHVRSIEDKGKTIYLYDENNATWVDGGVWYKIEGNSKLNSDQLSRIASSL